MRKLMRRSLMLGIAGLFVISAQVLTAGDNLVKNPSVEEGDRFPTNWGRWKGAGKMNWGGTEDLFHTGKKCAFITLLKFGKVKERNMAMAALIVGDSKGTAGPNTMVCEPNTTYNFSFWAKGNMPFVDVKGLGWATEAAPKAARIAIKTSVGRFKPTDEWKEYKGTFTTTEKTKKFVLMFYVGGYEDEGAELNKQLFIDDVTITKK